MHTSKTAAVIDVAACVVVFATLVAMPAIKKHRAKKQFATAWADVPGVTDPTTY